MQHSDVIREALEQQRRRISRLNYYTGREDDRIDAIDAALADLQQQDEGVTWEPVADGMYPTEDARFVLVKTGARIELVGSSSTALIAAIDLPLHWILCRTATPQPTDTFADFRNSHGAVDYAKQPGDVEVVVTVTPQQMELMETEARGTTLTVETIASTRLRKTMAQPTDKEAK